MSDTPEYARKNIDEIITSLNVNWDLGIPYLHGHRLQPFGTKKDIAEQCSVSIRYLCYKGINFQGILIDFEEQALTVLSEWVTKPSQENGTLPRRPGSDSFIRRDLASRANLDETKRGQLLSLLLSGLEEECCLARQSNSYQRISPQQSLAQPYRTSGGVPYETAPSSSRLSIGSISGISSYHDAVIGMDNDIAAVSMVEDQNDSRIKISAGTDQAHASLWQQKGTNPSLRMEQGSDPRPRSSSRYKPYQNYKPEWRFEDESDVSSPLVRSFQTTATSSSNPSFETTISSEPSRIFSIGGLSEVSLSSNSLPTKRTYSQTKITEYSRALKQSTNISTPASSFKLSCKAVQEMSITSPHTLSETGVFARPHVQLPCNLPYLQVFEIYRLSQATGLAPIQVFNDLKNSVVLGFQTTAEGFHTAVRRLCLDKGIGNFVQSDVKSWVTQDVQYEKYRRSVYLSGRLVFAKESVNSTQFTLDPIHVDTSCRFHRRFGADRFLILYIPSLASDPSPINVHQNQKIDGGNFREMFMHWLSSCVLHIAGRMWRAFFLETHKSKKKKNNNSKDKQQQLKIHFFAVDGTDSAFQSSHPYGTKYSAISIDYFADWHLNFIQNLQSPHVKMFARYGLGLSKTLSSIAFEQSEILYLPDTKKPVMNDGCALISRTAAHEIWDMVGSCKDMPCAFQGRIGGAKGLWIVDYRDTRRAPTDRGWWIEISDSQLKIKPHPSHCIRQDSLQRTFEIVKWSKPCSPGYLNAQLIPILEDRGVPRQVLQDTLTSGIRHYTEDAQAGMQDARLLRAWAQRYHFATDYELDLLPSGWPNSNGDRISLLVDSGFNAVDCLQLRKAVKSTVKDELETYVDKLRIQIPYSTTCFCVSDPYGVLEPDEVHLAFSSPWEKPLDGCRESTLDGIDVLVSRNPAHLASDIQKRTAVYKHELRHFKDVIIFSTKGTKPLASLLSGGDYDGDHVTVIWDPCFTQPFKNSMKPDLLPGPKCGLISKCKCLEEIMEESEVSAATYASFTKDCMLFNSLPTMLGLCTYELEKLVYNGETLSSSNISLLAALAGHLVDAEKQGWHLTDEAWASIRRTVWQSKKGSKIRNPAYKHSDLNPARAANGECVNVIDFLKFDVAEKEKERLLTDFHKTCSMKDFYDRSLSRSFLHEDNRLQDNHRDSQRMGVKLVLDHLKVSLGTIVERWTEAVGVPDTLQERGRDFKTEVAILYENVSKVTPPPDVECDIVYDFKRNGAGKGSRWSLLRASTMYYHHWRSSATWYAVGDELCRIKAQSYGPTREVLPSMHQLLKPNTNLIKRSYLRDLEPQPDLGEDDDDD